MITEFFGEYLWLSNFFPCRIEYDGYIYFSVEAAYQAQKFKGTVLQERYMKMIFTKITANEAKILGRMVNLRPDWEEIRDDLMEQLLRKKFIENDTYRDFLLNTDDEELIEENTWCDTHFGCCTCPIHNGEGENILGKMIMKLRDELKQKDN